MGARLTATTAMPAANTAMTAAAHKDLRRHFGADVSEGMVSGWSAT
jgi:hypothetical protein